MWVWPVVGLTLVGGAIGAFAARTVAMTAMPEMVALFNGSGGIAAYGQTGRYSRDTGGVDKFGNWSGFITALNTADYVEGLSDPLGNGGTNTALQAMVSVRVYEKYRLRL